MNRPGNVNRTPVLVVISEKTKRAKKTFYLFV